MGSSRGIGAGIAWELARRATVRKNLQSCAVIILIGIVGKRELESPVSIT